MLILKSSSPRIVALAVGLISFGLASGAGAAIYYVDASAGDDNNNGASASAAWKTIAKVNTGTFAAGDQILFKGGQTHAGNLTFSNTDSGAVGNPVIASSYGTGRAIIYAATGDAITLDKVAYMTVTNIDVLGPGWDQTTAKTHGVELSGIANHCILDHITASGFHTEGVDVGSSSHDNVLTYVTARDNGFVGIRVSGTNQYASDCQAFYNHGDLTVTNNWSGSGIFVEKASYVNSGVFRSCL